MLIHWDGFTIVEAAELLGLNASTARSRYAAARQILREALTEQSGPREVPFGRAKT
jgi:RNA polymerase sigma-70 factor, ECF subfamily